MSVTTSSSARALRRIARFLGLNRLIGGWMARLGYEKRFSDALLAHVRAGDIVWDVGANVGLYTVIFADLVGSSGTVTAFEPSEQNAGYLRNAIAGRDNCVLVQQAIGRANGELTLVQGADGIGATTRIALQGEKNLVRGQRVAVSSVDELIATRNFRPPNVLKLDVEGFELEAIRGMEQLLKTAPPRAFGIEVHFSLLEQRGHSDGPAEIEHVLRTAGYRVVWTDPSHIVAWK